MNLQKNLLNIGTIVNTFGTKGMVKMVISENTFINGDISEIKLVFTKKDSGSYIPLRVEEIQNKENNLLIKFVGLDSINDVVKFKNINLFFDNTDEIFIYETPLTEFICIYGNDKIKVIDLMNNGVQDLIKVSYKLKEFWIPMVEMFVDNIDEQEQKIYLKNIEGLM
ncbi:ribosome maturation factor RimM [Mesoplasma photuris]|uniref:ribosome maturation factor RimM n=1 Tax=Mesoplasma photuris TaxID=217731 RepID=UPI0004E14C27|nr:hypothetical protein [Mesoplasma photuris]